MNMQDDEDIIPFLRDKSKSHYPSNRSFLEPTKCPTCGQSTKVYTVPRFDFVSFLSSLDLKFSVRKLFSTSI